MRVFAHNRAHPNFLRLFHPNQDTPRQQLIDHLVIYLTLVQIVLSYEKVHVYLSLFLLPLIKNPLYMAVGNQIFSLVYANAMLNNELLSFPTFLDEDCILKFQLEEI